MLDTGLLEGARLDTGLLDTGFLEVTSALDELGCVLLCSLEEGIIILCVLLVSVISP
ncbi:MAG: hypothetical protein J6I80_00155 [Clostridia bacterium]|nr:hypothetical protein [Clostridia bacterium]